MVDHELDVRVLRKPDKHPRIFETYRAQDQGESFVLINNHDPVHLRDEFEAEYPGGFGWDYVESGPEVWRVRISKFTVSAPPRVLYDTSVDAEATDAAGAVWKLQVRERDLDANIVQLPPEGLIDAHDGPDLDVLIHVVGGSGRLRTELGSLPLQAGAVVWLPRRSRREFTAGADGLSYLSVHQRKPALSIAARD